jgi:predicted homoserine dehydrogenase-like protein
MNLYAKLLQREEAGKPITVGLIGAGKFGTMFLTQARATPGIHVVGVADVSVARARSQLALSCWPQERYAATSLADARRHRSTFLTDDAEALIRSSEVDVVIDATGEPKFGVRIALAAIEAGKHIVMVNVEADVLAGPLLARKARQAGVVYSLAWGDQPSIICEHVDWARACGFRVVAAGKGTRYLPHYHQSTPETIYDILQGFIDVSDRSTINPKMFNSFLDGTKSGVEMTAICNATGLHSQSNGIAFPPASRFEISDVCRPASDGGTLEKAGVTECVSSLRRDGAHIPHELSHGTFVVFEAPDDNAYARECLREYHALPDSTGRYSTLYRPIHLNGLELGVSVASAALRNEATGAPICFNADVVATAKRKLKTGEVLDGEGGFCVWGKQQPAQVSLRERYLPLGLAQHVQLVRDVAEGACVTWDDVAIDASDQVVKIRREMEQEFGKRPARAA